MGWGGRQGPGRMPDEEGTGAQEEERATRMKKEGTIRVTPRISVCGGLDWKKLLVFEE